MREIKYRAYIKNKNPRVPKETNKMVEVKSLHLGSKKAIIGYSGGNYSIKFDEIELMQYTGLKDRNMKEIYEGDIVEFKDIGEEGYEYKEGFDFDNIAQVVYKNGIYTLSNFGETDNSYYATNCTDAERLEEVLRNGNCKVIGNIYDNPELLEKGE